MWHMSLQMIICSNICGICWYNWCVYRNIRLSQHVASVAKDDSSITTCDICCYRWFYVATFVAYVATTDAYVATLVCHNMWHMLLQMILYYNMWHMSLYMIISSNICGICCYSWCVYHNIRLSRHVTYVATDDSSITTYGIYCYRWFVCINICGICCHI